MRFSANLGFLWTDRSLPDAIRAAHKAGFAAVECHWPYDTDPDEVRAALDQTQLPMLSLNTSRGDTLVGENGLAALPNRQSDARAAIDQAITYSNHIGAKCIHVMAGTSNGLEAEKTFITNLSYACNKAKTHGQTILIEALNEHDAPGYFLKTTDQAAQIIAKVKSTQLKLMFDCYHVGRTEGDVTCRINKLKGIIGHIQFASVPTRVEPSQGELNYDAVFTAIAAMGWSQPLGAEYKPGKDTDASLEWMAKWR